MNRIEILKTHVEALYESKHSDRDEWADWLFQNHIFIVGRYASEIAERFGGEKDVAMAAGILHDIADSVMARENQQHAEKSAEIARELLGKSGFSELEIRTIIDDAMRFHGCRDNAVPQTPEGRAMATGDALAHLKTDFYVFALGQRLKYQAMGKVRGWALPKIERDYRQKIFFDEIRAEAAPDYERVKKLFNEG